jgi:hypothetical protein
MFFVWGEASRLGIVPPAEKPQFPATPEGLIAKRQQVGCNWQREILARRYGKADSYPSAGRMT